MNYTNLMYNVNGNALVNSKFNRIKEFTKLLVNPEDKSIDTFTENETNTLGKIIDGCKDSGDYMSLILHIPIKNDGLFKRYLFAFYTIVYLFTKSDKEISRENFNIINDQFKLIEKEISMNQELLKDSFVDNVINNLGYYIKSIERVINNITTDYAYYISPKTLHSVTNLTEAIGDSDSGENKIFSTSDPDGSKTSVDITLGINPGEYLLEILNEDDHDYFVHKISKLYNYLVSLKGNYDDEHTKAFIETVNYAISKVINDITGKEILLITLSKCDQLLTDIIPNSHESFENIEIMIAKIEEITRVIEEHPEGDVSLLDEMGLGYIYDILPKDENIPLSEAAIEYLTNYAEDNNMLSTMNEAISILNEGIKDNVKKYIDKKKDRRRKEEEFKEKVKDEKYSIHDDTYDTRVDISRRRQNDEYDLERDEKRDKYDDKHELSKQDKTDKYGLKQENRQDKYNLRQENRQDKYDLKQQKRQDKYDFKKQKKLDKYEQKKSIKEEDRQRRIEHAEQKRQERLEARQRKRDETKIGLNRWKTLELTNSNARKAANALRKVVKAGATAGVAALAGFNPIFAGATYLIGSYVKDKTNPRAERRKLVDEMQLQLTEIDEKIEQAERKGEDDKKLALMKMRKKISTACNRTGLLHKMELEMSE